MRLGILGGSFNPVHNGHLFLADAALSDLKLDRLVLIPAYQSPFKLDSMETDNSVNVKDRLDMLASAVIGDMRLAIDDCEIRRGGVSYTVDTIQDIIARYMPSGKPVLIIGDDLAADFPKWYESEKILQLANIVIGRRKMAANSKETADYPFAHTFIDNEIMNISSHDIRQKIKDGLEWRYLVPHGVRTIIEDRRLYGFSGNLLPSEDCTNEMIVRVETTARQSLTTERFLHSKNTALFASDLCRRFGLNPMAGYLAGIAHDLAKQLDNKQILKLIKSDELPISNIEKDKPNLLHGRAAAVLLKERFSIHNKDILEAVAVHTSGSEYMGPLAKVIYIADKTEMTRNIDPVLRKLCMEGDLDNILFAVLKKTISKLESRELELSEETLRLLDRMKERNR